MTDVPKIVYDRLRAPAQGASGQAHPEADLLTAFAELSLSGPEREGVLEHLALCGDCREVVAFALPATDFAGASIAADADRNRATDTWARAATPRKAALTWPMLRWAALAAAIVVAAAVLLVRPGTLNPRTPASLNTRVANATPAAAGTQSAVPTSASSPVAPQQAAQSSATSLTAAEQSKPALPVSKKSNSPTTTAATQAESGMLLASNRAGNSKDSVQLGRSAMPSAPNAAFSYDAAPSRTATETVEVSRAAVGIESQTSGANALIAQSDAPIVKAKPAPQDSEENKQQKTPAPAANAFADAQRSSSRDASKMAVIAGAAFESNVSWAIKAGALQWSLDKGKSWQEALRADHPLSNYASQGRDIWAGGQAGTLFHSADGGVSWAQVRPTIGSLSLTADVSNIQAPAPGLIVVSTSANETWTSSDAGKTWTKK